MISPSRVLDFFDKAYLINLDKRKDRLASSTAILGGLGIPFERFPAISISDNATFRADGAIFSKLHSIWITCSFGLYSCGLSHHAVLVAARDQNLSNVLIMEDDILPCEGFVEKAKECLSELRGKDWGLFYFYHDNPIPVGKHIARLPKAAWRTHCYAVNGPAIAPLIKMIETYGAHFYGPNCWWDAIDDMYVSYSARFGVSSYGSIQTLARQMGDEGTGTEGDSDADTYVPKAPISNPNALKGVRYATARNWDKPETIYWYEDDRFVGGPERGGGVYAEKSLRQGDPVKAVLKWDNWQPSVCLPANDGFYCKDHELFISATPMEIVATRGEDDDSKIKDFCERAKIDYQSLAGFMLEDSAPRRQEIGSVYPIEGQVLYALVRVLRPETVLEFGTMYGCSTEHIVAALERNDFGRLVSVDINPQTSLKSPRLEIVKGDGLEFAEKWNEPVGMVFEDGPHSFHFTYSVLSRLLPHLAEKGCFIVHDIDFPFMAIGFQTQYQVKGGFLAATKSFYPLSLTPPPGRQPQGLGYFSRALKSGAK